MQVTIMKDIMYINYKNRRKKLNNERRIYTIVKINK